jgi:hypothetical protein
MEQKEEPELVKITKSNRYYYKHREEILEKKRIARLAKKGLDVDTSKEEERMSSEEKRKKKMELLGLINSSKIVPCVSPGRE